jgi:hypothetical protein
VDEKTLIRTTDDMFWYIREWQRSRDPKALEIIASLASTLKSQGYEVTYHKRLHNLHVAPQPRREP